MKHIIQKILVTCICIIYTALVSAQSQIPGAYTGCDCLGIWTYITISDSNRQGDGTYKCTISIPPEGISPFTNPSGVGSPQFQNNLGSTIDLVFSSDLKNELAFATDDNPAIVEIPVNKWVRDCFYYTEEGDNRIRCFYIVILQPSF